MNLKTLFLFIGCCLCSAAVHAQGPPITADKPIMLGAKRKIIKTLTEIRNTRSGVYTKVPLMMHYLPTHNSLVALHLPFVQISPKDKLNGGGVQSGIGDLQILGKYQYFRRDQTGSTFRMVLKTLQTLSTSSVDPGFNIDGIVSKTYQSYIGTVAGYESIKYGVSSEAGVNLDPEGKDDELRYKLGFGLPLMKPLYPVKQINLYFEYTSKWFYTTDEYQLLYAQGIQYAIKQFTFEVAIQVPLYQKITFENELLSSVFLGTRYVF